MLIPSADDRWLHTEPLLAKKLGCPAPRLTPSVLPIEGLTWICETDAADVHDDLFSCSRRTMQDRHMSMYRNANAIETPTATPTDVFCSMTGSRSVKLHTDNTEITSKGELSKENRQTRQATTPIIYKSEYLHWYDTFEVGTGQSISCIS